jgi:dTDP-4-amino-4,6-dideoxygalactose transaminase
MNSPSKIKSANLGWQFEQLGDIQSELMAILTSGNYVSGNYVNNFEKSFSDYSSQKYGIGVNSGTSALHAALQALNLNPGDEVILPSHTFIASATAVILAGGIPVLVDVEENGLVSASKIEKGLSKKTKVIMPVHLYGSPVPLEEMKKITEFGIPIVEDCSQAHGARFDEEQSVGIFSEISCYSLYPGKGLGAVGEAGICLTDDMDLAKKMKLFRNWGSEEKYFHENFGVNYRMDEIQALVLLKKMTHLENWNMRRREIASLYRQNIRNHAFVNETRGVPVFHQFVIRTSKREQLQEFLKLKGIETLIHYPIPIHKQKALQNYTTKIEDYATTETLCAEILSLPIYPGLTNAEIEKIIESVNAFGL